MNTKLNDISDLIEFKRDLEYCLNDIILSINGTSIILDTFSKKYPEHEELFTEIFGVSFKTAISKIQNNQSYLKGIIADCKNTIEELYKNYQQRETLIVKNLKTAPISNTFKSLIASIENSKNPKESANMCVHHLSRSRNECLDSIKTVLKYWSGSEAKSFASQLETIVDNSLDNTRLKLMQLADLLPQISQKPQQIQSSKPTIPNLKKIPTQSSDNELSENDYNLWIQNTLNLHKEIVGNFNLDYRAAFEFFAEKMPHLRTENVNNVLTNCYNHNHDYINSSLTDKERSHQMQLIKKNSSTTERYLQIILSLLTQDLNSIKNTIEKLAEINTSKSRELIKKDIQLLMDFSQLKQLLESTYSQIKTMSTEDVSTQ